MALLLAAALALRLYGLGNGLWYDEILTNVTYTRMPYAEIITTYESENQHFLYTLMAHASAQVFGDTPAALRLPAVLFGVGSLWALYLLGRQVAGQREAFLATALLTFTYSHVWFSQNARGYSGLLFWSLLSSWLLLRALAEGQARLWLFYAVAAALGMYTHFTMIFVIAGQALWALLRLVRPRAGEKPAWAAAAAGLVGAGLLTALLYGPVLPQLLGGMGREVSEVEAWKNPLWTLLELVQGMQLGFGSGFVAVGALVVGGAGLLSFARSKPVVVFLLVVPAVVGAAVVIVMGHHLWPRFFFFAFGFAALVAVRGTSLVGQWLGRFVSRPRLSSEVWGTLVCLALIAASATSLRWVYLPKQDYEGAMAYVDANSQPGDHIVTAGLAGFVYSRYYLRDWSEVETGAALAAQRAQAPRTWLLYTFPPVLEAVSPDVMAAVRTDCQSSKEFWGTVGSGNIYVCLFAGSAQTGAGR